MNSEGTYRVPSKARFIIQRCSSEIHLHPRPGSEPKLGFRVRHLRMTGLCSGQPIRPKAPDGTKSLSATGDGRVASEAASPAAAALRGQAGRLRSAELRLVAGYAAGRAGASGKAPTMLHLAAWRRGRCALFRSACAGSESQGSEDDDRQAWHRASPVLEALTAASPRPFQGPAPPSLS